MTPWSSRRSTAPAGDLLGRHFQGQARSQGSASPFGDHPAVFAVHFGDVDEGDWADGY